MFILKTIIFGTTSIIGFLFSKKYSNREKNLKELKSALNVFETKIKYTYEPIAEIFKEISKNSNQKIAELFLDASNKMNNMNAGQAWNNAIEECNIEINKEDKIILKGLSKLLGKTSLDGQVSEIELTSDFLDKQIKIAEQEKIKNEKLYRTLGICMGLVIVILLI